MQKARYTSPMPLESWVYSCSHRAVLHTAGCVLAITGLPLLSPSFAQHFRLTEGNNSVLPLCSRWVNCKTEGLRDERQGRLACWWISLAREVHVGSCLVSWVWWSLSARGRRASVYQWMSFALGAFSNLSLNIRKIVTSRNTASQIACKLRSAWCTGLFPGLVSISSPVGESEASDIRDEVEKLDLENIFPIFAERLRPGVLPSVPSASCVKYCQYEIMFQLRYQTDWFNSYHESIFLYYYVLTMWLMYQTPKEMVSAQRALSKRNMPGEDRAQ